MSGPAGDIIVEIPDIIVVHPQTAVADGKSDPSIIIAVGVHGPILQAGVEGQTRRARFREPHTVHCPQFWIMRKLEAVSWSSQPEGGIA